MVNTNRKGEGKSEDCLGFVTLGNETYRTLWKNDYVGETFAKEESLLVFYLDNNDKMVKFVDYHKSKNIESKPIDEFIHNSITIRVECSRAIIRSRLPRRSKT